MPSETIDGYLGDEVYPSSFHRQFTPPWIDAMLRHRGIRPPRTEDRAPFALLDLGCGDGLALVGLAAAHPEGRFIGVDALREHVERGKASAAYAGIANVSFVHARFGDIDDPAEPIFDYVTAQGVLAWVSPENREHVRRLCGRQLKPGGIACIGYNGMPGWSRGLAVQQLLLQFAEGVPGNATQRFAAALAQVRTIAAAKGAGAEQQFLAWLDEISGTLPSRYFPHEYLNVFWQPLWSGPEHAAMAAHGLRYVGTSRAEMLRPDHVLSPEQREALAAIGGDAARETARDVMLDQTFRIDLFGKDIPDPDAGRSPGLEGWWCAKTTEAEAGFELVSPAVTVDFDRPATRRLLAALADGPHRLADIAASCPGETDADLRDAIDALWMSGQVLPCDPPLDPPAAARFNALNAAAARHGAPLQALVGRHGAMPVDHATIRGADDGEAPALAALARLGIRLTPHSA